MVEPPKVQNEVARHVTSGGGALIATIAPFKGNMVCDVRKFYTKGDVLAPTPKGIAVEISRLPALVELVTAALADARARGLVPHERAA